jgi:hypothetical protein
MHSKIKKNKINPFVHNYKIPFLDFNKYNQIILSVKSNKCAKKLIIISNNKENYLLNKIKIMINYYQL